MGTLASACDTDRATGPYREPAQRRGAESDPGRGRRVARRRRRGADHRGRDRRAGGRRQANDLPLVAIEKRGNATFADVKDLVAGVRGAAVLENGEMDAGIWSAGQTQALIHDTPTCAELVTRILREAEQIIRARLTGMI